MPVTRTSGQGRPKGAKNKANAKREAEIAASGLTPLQFLIGEMRNSTNTLEFRADCAKAAAPYIHPKLANVQHSTDPQKPFQLQVIERRIVKAGDPDR
jgi:hypothetical protein